MRAEEERFRETLERGLKVFEELAGRDAITGEEAFTLAATYGFPIELTVELAEERGQAVDVDGYREEMAQHREISRAGGDTSVAQAGEFDRTTDFRTEFVGYEKTDVLTQIGALADAGEGRFLAKLRESPFYPAGGGQVSDAGWIEGEDGRRAELQRGLPARRRPGAPLRGRGLRGGRSACTPSCRGPSASRRWRTTRPRTCSTRRCGTCSATTSGRRARPSVPTSSASTSRTSTR